ncbi:MAG: hypothetical protein IJW55_04435 [Clostridia bacterium]|nr:hypothetical protein [Clostridia bacterium]
MNEDTVFTNDQNSTGTNGGDPLPPTGAEVDGGEGTARTDASTLAPRDAEALAVFEDPGTDLDLSAPADPAPLAEDGMEQLRTELRELRRALDERDAFFGRLGKECEEFSALYPDASLSSLPDSVWDDVRRGIPLAAAYALAERRRARTEERAKESNLENGKRSAGAVGGAQDDYFSPAEVRAMSQSEVRANYQSIMRSMQKWR